MLRCRQQRLLVQQLIGTTPLPAELFYNRVVQLIQLQFPATKRIMQKRETRLQVVYLLQERVLQQRSMPFLSTPTPTSNSPVCAGSTINLSTSAVGGATYSWTGPNGFTSSLQSPTIANATAAMAGIYNVTVTTNSCTSAAGSTTPVVVNVIASTPTPTSNSPVCAGSTINLSTTAVGGATYSWTGPNGFTSSLQNPTIANATAAMAGVL